MPLFKKLDDPDNDTWSLDLSQVETILIHKVEGVYIQHIVTKDGQIVEFKDANDISDTLHK